MSDPLIIDPPEETLTPDTAPLDAGEDVDVDELDTQVVLPPRNALRRYSFLVSVPPDPLTLAARAQSEPPVVRRPLLGLDAYENSYASLEVIANTNTETGRPISLINTSYRDGVAGVTTNFLLSNVSEPLPEVVDILPSFGDFFVQSSGEPIRSVSLSGILLESKNFPWLREWRRNYNRYLRARQCILRRAMVYLTVGNTMYVGYIIDSALSRSWEAWGMAPFNFTMVLREVVDVYEAGRYFDAQGDTREEATVDGIRIPPSVIVDPARNAQLRSEAADPIATAQDEIDFMRMDSRILGDRSIPELGGRSLAELADEREQLLAAQIAEANTQFAELRAMELAQAIETVQGRPDARALPELVLGDAGTEAQALAQFQLDQLVAVATQLNATFPGFIDIQALRRNYMNNRRRELEAIGQYDPFGPARYGLPTAYQDTVDARRRRQQEETARRVLGFLEDEFIDPDTGRFQVF